jgi:tetratricopeptide (TPR) repeat protein
MMRSQIGAGAAAGSTVFVASRSATADGNALVGRNVDWIDFGGRLKPTVIRYHPENGDLRYISAAWPLLQLPTVGLNEAGLAFSLNYFDTDPQMAPTAMSYPYRRVLQRASNVDEAIALFQADFPIIIPCFGALADAKGNLALLECTTTACEVFRPDGDWFAHSNHARTEAMIPHDRFRGSDSFDRRRLMEAAVAKHLGRLDAARAAEVVRNRDGHAHPNASVVANLYVLNAAILEPARRILWHSDLIQPFAPFGRYIPIAIGDDAEIPAPIPAAARLATAAHAREARVVEQVRAARNARHIAGDLERSLTLWEQIFAEPPEPLDPAALAIDYADALLDAGRFDEAAAVLEREVGADARWDDRIHAALLLGVCADAAGDRERALERYAAAIALINERPEFTAYESQRALATRGQHDPLAASDLELSLWVTGVPP